MNIYYFYRPTYKCLNANYYQSGMFGGIMVKKVKKRCNLGFEPYV